MNATMSLENTKHYPVMLNQILSIISPQHGGMFIDCTLGGGGYSKAILQFQDTKVLAIDRDKLADKHAIKISKQFPNRFKFFHEKFSNLNKLANSSTNPRAIIFDLGLSSYQIADNNRGFSFKSNAPLNMQMGINTCSVLDVVNKIKKNTLIDILRFLGEEKEARRVTDEIIKNRTRRPIKKTDELVSIIKKAKKKNNKQKIDPATKTFQALRIFVNKELTELINGLFSATEVLKNDGILIVVSFHSLEDRIVKNFLKFYSSKNSNPSRYMPKKNNSEKNHLFKLISKNALTPEDSEIIKNSRSRSAKLRYAIRNENSFFYSNEIKSKFAKYLNIEETSV